MDKPVSTARPGRTHGTVAQTGLFPKRHPGGDRSGLPGGAPPASVVGSEEVADHRVQTPSALGLARTLHRLRHPEPAWQGADEASSPEDRLSGQTREPDPCPNDTWGADFKGQFKTYDGIYCYLLTVTDGYSRYLLGCQALYSTAVQGAKPVCTKLFKEYGLPRRIRTDNGGPFVAHALAAFPASPLGGCGWECCRR